MQSTETNGNDAARPSRSSKLSLSALGILLTADAAAVILCFPSAVSVAITGVIGIALLLILAKRAPHPELFVVGIIGGAPSAFLVLGVGGLVVIEMARLTGSNVYLALRIVFYILAGGMTLGTYLAVALAALAAAGVRRPWLPVATMLLFPLIIVIGSSSTREALSSGVSVLNYALLATGFATFGLVAWPRVRRYYRALLEAKRLDEKWSRDLRNEPTDEPMPFHRVPNFLFADDPLGTAEGRSAGSA